MILSLGYRLIPWIEAELCHGVGDVRGQPIELTDEQAWFFIRAYEVNERGRRRYRRVALSRSKGWAKSETAGMAVCAEFLGPVRFDHWGADGQPVGRPVRSPYIPIFATEEEQTGNTYDHVRVMLEEGRIARTQGLDVGMTRALRAGGGEVAPRPSSAIAAEGSLSTFLVLDETHLFVLPVLRKLHATALRNLAKRALAEPWSLETTTMFRPGENSIAEGTYEHARAILEGRIAADGLLYDHRQAPPVPDLGDDEVLRPALREVYGDAAEWMDLDRIMQEMRDPQTDPADARRYWLNQPVAGEGSWMDPQEWERCRRLDDEVGDGEMVTLGFDGSRFDDATALIGCRVRDGRLFVPRVDGRRTIWESPPDHAESGWEVPLHEVDAAVAECFGRYQVVRMYADPPRWEDTIGRWAAEFGKKRVVFWWTNRRAQIGYAVGRLETAVRARELTHDGDPVLARHVGNAYADTTRWGHLLRKDRPLSPRKIDAAMAAILAYEARGDVVAAGEDRPPRRHAHAGW